MRTKPDARKLSPAAQEDLRRRVVHAIVEQGMSQVEAVRIFQVGRTSVHNWLKAYREGGAAALGGSYRPALAQWLATRVTWPRDARKRPETPNPSRIRALAA